MATRINDSQNNPNHPQNIENTVPNIDKILKSEEITHYLVKNLDDLRNVDSSQTIDKHDAEELNKYTSISNWNGLELVIFKHIQKSSESLFRKFLTETENWTVFPIADPSNCETSNNRKNLSESLSDFLGCLTLKPLMDNHNIDLTTSLYDQFFESKYILENLSNESKPNISCLCDMYKNRELSDKKNYGKNELEKNNRISVDCFDFTFLEDISMVIEIVYSDFIFECLILLSRIISLEKSLETDDLKAIEMTIIINLNQSQLSSIDKIIETSYFLSPTIKILLVLIHRKFEYEIKNFSSCSFHDECYCINTSEKSKKEKSSQEIRSLIFHNPLYNEKTYENSSKLANHRLFENILHSFELLLEKTLCFPTGFSLNRAVLSLIFNRLNVVLSKNVELIPELTKKLAIYLQNASIISILQNNPEIRVYLIMEIRCLNINFDLSQLLPVKNKVNKFQAEIAIIESYTDISIKVCDTDYQFMDIIFDFLNRAIISDLRSKYNGNEKIDIFSRMSKQIRSIVHNGRYNPRVAEFEVTELFYYILNIVIISKSYDFDSFDIIDLLMLYHSICGKKPIVGLELILRKSKLEWFQLNLKEILNFDLLRYNTAHKITIWQLTIWGDNFQHCCQSNAHLIPTHLPFIDFLEYIKTLRLDKYEIYTLIYSCPFSKLEGCIFIQYREQFEKIQVCKDINSHNQFSESYKKEFITNHLEIFLNLGFNSTELCYFFTLLSTRIRNYSQTNLDDMLYYLKISKQAFRTKSIMFESFLDSMFIKDEKFLFSNGNEFLTKNCYFTKCEERSVDDLFSLFSEINDCFMKEHPDFELKRKLISYNNEFEKWDVLINKPIKNFEADDIKKWTKNFRSNPTRCSDLEILAVIGRGLEISSGYRPRPAQIIPLLTMIYQPKKNMFFQVKTGEGKTYIVALLAVYKALVDNVYVDIITSSCLLAEEQSKSMSSFYEMFHLTCGNNVVDSEKSEAYSKTITYGDPKEFKGDVLKDQIGGSSLLKGRKPEYCIIDEVDNIFLDEVTQLLFLSGGISFITNITSLLAVIWNCVIQLIANTYTDTDENSFQIPSELMYIENNNKKLLKNLQIFMHTRSERKFFITPDNILPEELTEMIDSFSSEKLEEDCIFEIKFIEDLKKYIIDDTLLYCRKLLRDYNKLDNDIVEELKGSQETESSFPELKLPDFIRPLVLNVQLEQYVNSAWCSLFTVENVDYIIENNEISIVDHENTGCVDKESKWSSGLHQFIELRHGLYPSRESITTNYMSNLALIRRYGTITGLTGTIGDKYSQEFLKTTFNVDSFYIPEFQSKQFFLFDLIINHSREDWVSSISENIRILSESGRSILLLMKNIKEVYNMEKILKNSGVQSTKIRIFEMNDHIEVIHAPIQPGEIIISTNISGRGTDIQTTSSAETLGGLHVCLTFLPKNKRVFEQNIGRTARSGKKGTAQLILDQTQIKSDFPLKNNADVFQFLSDQERIQMKRLQDKVNHQSAKDEIFCCFKNIVENIKESNIKDSLNEQFGIWLLEEKTKIDALDSRSKGAEFFKQKFPYQKGMNDHVFKNPAFLLQNIDSLVDKNSSTRAALSKINQAIEIDKSETIPILYFIRGWIYLKINESYQKSKEPDYATIRSQIRLAISDFKKARFILKNHVQVGEMMVHNFLMDNQKSLDRFEKRLSTQNRLITTINKLVGIDISERLDKKIGIQKKDLEEVSKNIILNVNPEQTDNLKQKKAVLEKRIEKLQKKIDESNSSKEKKNERESSEKGLLTIALEREMNVDVHELNYEEALRNDMNIDDEFIFDELEKDHYHLFDIKLSNRPEPESEKVSLFATILRIGVGIARIAYGMAISCYGDFFAGASQIWNGFNDIYNACSDYYNERSFSYPSALKSVPGV